MAKIASALEVRQAVPAEACPLQPSGAIQIEVSGRAAIGVERGDVIRAATRIWPAAGMTNKATPTISIDNISKGALGGGSFTPTCNHSDNGSPIESVASSKTKICTVSGGVVHFIAAGNCTLTASTTATMDYTPVAGSPQSLTVMR